MDRVGDGGHYAYYSCMLLRFGFYVVKVFMHKILTWHCRDIIKKLSVIQYVHGCRII